MLLEMGWGGAYALHATLAKMSCTLREHMFDVTVTTYVATLAHAMFLGFDALLTAFAEYRKDRKKKQIGLQPADMYDLTKENAWLP